MRILNKSFMTNLIALVITSIGVYIADKHVTNIGFYALSGALTNWIAIYMLFEKIPFVYGSGIIPNKFESFKSAIKKMIMEQFFSSKNLDKFLNGDEIKKYAKATISKKIDHNKIFDSFVALLLDSKYVSLINMFMSDNTLEKLRESFIVKIDESLEQIIENVDIDISKISVQEIAKIEKVINTRLKELTPSMVKELIQKIIREHLGWLVVWGGVFGGLIGLVLSFIS